MKRKHRNNGRPIPKTSNPVASHPQASPDEIPAAPSDTNMKDKNSPPFPLRIEKAYKALAKDPSLQAMLDRHGKKILEVVNGQRNDDAASAVMDGFVKAIVDFDPVRAEWAWLMRHANWALKTANRMCRPSTVRDAYTDYMRNNQKGPTLEQLAKAADLTTREVLVVWHLVAEELKIDASQDTVIGSLPKFLQGALTSSFSIESLDVFFVRARNLDPLSYALLLLNHVNGYTGTEIRAFAADLQQKHADGVSRSGLEADIQAFANGFGVLLGLEWTDLWLDVRTCEQIRTRIHRAKEILRSEGGSDSIQYFAA